MLSEVKQTSAEHVYVASASLRGDTWQLQVHASIARRTTRSDLTVRSDRADASRSNGESYETRSFTCAQPEDACVHRCEVLGRTASASAVRGVRPMGSDAFRYLSSDPTLLGLRLLITGSVLTAVS